MRWITQHAAAPLLYALWVLVSFVTAKVGWPGATPTGVVLHFFGMVALSVPAVFCWRSFALVQMRGPLMALVLPLHAASLLLPSIPMGLGVWSLLLAWLVLLHTPAWVEDRIRARLFGRVSSAEIDAWFEAQRPVVWSIAGHAHTKPEDLTNMRADLANIATGAGPVLLHGSFQAHQTNGHFHTTDIRFTTPELRGDLDVLQKSLRRTVGQRAFPEMTVRTTIVPQTSAHAVLAKQASERNAPPKGTTMPKVRPFAKPSKVHMPIWMASSVAFMMSLVIVLIVTAQQSDSARTAAALAHHAATMRDTTPSPVSAEVVRGLNARATQGELFLALDHVANAPFVACVDTPQGTLTYVVAQTHDSAHLVVQTDTVAKRLFAQNPCAQRAQRG